MDLTDRPPLMPVDPVSRANNRQLRYRIVRDLYSLADELEGDNDIAAAAITGESRIPNAG